ncbi:heterokaryon incompatibility protein-domain-containing protein [Xylaria arbuscula]|nr:heterokaryon incompatibility protein-domain-containing protein [Xylaria arbuscula]
MNYKPLDVGRNEMRVICLHPDSSQDSPIECTLEHVSLDEYSDEYKIFLELDGVGKSSSYQARSWRLITDWAPPSDWFHPDESPKSLGRNVAAGFSKNPVYQEHRFLNAPKYVWGDFVALSYEWGDANDTENIVVDGVPTSITKNLKNALQTLRSPKHRELKGKPVYYWVDALCINQADIFERNAQVQRMGEIYSSARTVFIMTGPAVKDEQAVTELLDKCQHGFLRKNSPSYYNIREAFVEQNLAGWRSICEIASRSYWCRLWVIQEVLLANLAVLVYGRKVYVRLDFFFNVVNFIGQSRAYTESPLSIDWMRYMDSIFNFVPLWTLKNEGRLQEEGLLLLLDTARKAKQLDPRDKIYGLLGLIEESIHIQPDYRLPLVEVYRNFVQEVIKATGALSIIYQTASFRKAVSSWPSWVPDWFAQTTQTCPEPIAAIWYNRVCAAGDSLHMYITSNNPDLLYCEGFIVDTIGQLGCTIDPNLNATHTIHDRCSLSLGDSRISIYKDSVAVRQGFLNVLTLNWGVSREEKSTEYLPKMLHFGGRGKNALFSAISRFQQCNGGLTVAQQPLISHFPLWSQEYSDLSGVSTRVLETLHQLLLVMILRRFVVTQKGRMGIVPRHAKLGDAIFILKGCNAPLILRPAGDGTYSILGECYIDGIMHGEAMEDLAAGRYQARQIILC